MASRRLTINPEAALYVNDAFLAHYNKPARARLRGLARNPAIPAGLLRRLVDEQLREIGSTLTFHKKWTDEQFEAVASSPDRKVREMLAQAVHVMPEQRARLVEDPEPGVLRALVEGPDYLLTWTWTPQPTLPVWAYERLLERNPEFELILADSPWLPQDLRARLYPAGSSPAPDEPPLDREQAEARACDDNEWTRVAAATDPRLPGDLVARLAVDPSPEVRLAVSMRPELNEQQRAAIDYHVGPDDRVRPARWATDTRDPRVQRRCVFSAHIGLRRSVACNRHLTPDLVAVLATDDDFAVRLMLCENNPHVDSDTVLDTYLEATTMTRGRLLHPPRFPRTGLARLAGSPDPQARALVVLDPDAAPELIERISHDAHPVVRQWTADDPRLSSGRVLELFDDPSTGEAAAANPHLPVPVMRRILDVAAPLADDPAEGRAAVYLGRWSPDQLPPEED
ncbi:hypothetical protein AAFH96_10700 [Polymorphospora sp. 2-325]|uniref:Uncharacterized protein n=1 Tax=Polymorphospora lycopeni TaxID=3140240 RepID=A0ABV5CRZ9_9ACTN